MASQKQNGAQDTGLDPTLLLVGCLLLFAFGFIFWSTYHTAIATGYSWVRVVQFWPFVILGNGYSGIAGGLLLIGGGAVWFKKKQLAKYGLWAVIVGLILIGAYLIGEMFASWFVFFKDSDKSAIEWGHLTKSSFYSNLFTICVGVIPMAVWMVRRSLASNPTNHKHFARGKDYTLHTFTDRMAEHYPHLALFRKLNLTDRPINSGKYRMADTEKQFAIKHKLLDRVKANEFKVNRDRATQVFLDQMTKLWTGYNGLTRWEQAVIAVLLPRIAATDPAMSDRDYKAALERTDELLLGYWKDAAASYDESADTLKLNMKLARETIKKYGHSPKVKQFYKAHAYVGTILYSMLLEARTLGVLQPAELRWLRVVDRRLWFIIDNVGKIVATTEMGATYAHFLHELKQKRAIEKPMIDGAVRALIEGVESYAFASDEIKEINKYLDEQQKAEAQQIELLSKSREQMNLIVMLLTVGAGAKKSLFEAAILKENGDVLHSSRCKPAHGIDLEARERFKLSDADLQEIDKACAPDELKTTLLSLCNGHKVVTFDSALVDLVPGMDRSAADIVLCKGDEEFDLSSTAVMEGAATEDQLSPIRDAVSAAKLCREIWVCQQKAALKAQAESGRV